MLPGAVLVPYAVEVHGQIVKVFDPRLHERIAPEVSTDRRHDGQGAAPTKERRRDQRWAVAKRPMVSVGGELTLQDLELRYSPVSHFYIAPLQWKANSGVLIIDDFGRQMIQPQELLNRWIVPMEQGVDHLSLHTGDTVELPFETLLIFSSNIPPGRLGDEAFFRRIRHKVEVNAPTREVYERIFNMNAKRLGMNPCPEAVDYLYERYYNNNRSPRASDCRDLLEIVQSICRFRRQHVHLTKDLIAESAASFICDAFGHAAWRGMTRRCRRRCAS
jgi:hypothetical protein